MPAKSAIRSKTKREAFESLCQVEPRLRQLATLIGEINDPGTTPFFCANEVWYRVWKPKVCRLVGWDRITGPDSLKSEEAYDVAYETLYDLLPPCRHESTVSCL